MAKTKISEFSANPANNTDIDSINIAEGCAPSGINDAIRELMAQLKDFQAGTAGDSFNGPVGTTTAAAGAFTTLSASGAVTLNAGTANGVAYLNGSKVLTTGSALVFDGTGKLNVSSATGSASPTPSELQIATTTSASDWSTTSPWGRLSFYSADASAAGAKIHAQIAATAATTAGGYSSLNFSVIDTSGTALLKTMEFVADGSNSTQSIFYSGAGVEGMRLTSTGLGIGTSSPAQKLVVSNAGAQGFEFDPSTGIVQVYNRSTSAYGELRPYGSLIRWFTGTSPTEKMRLDSSGNLGLGVTPSAWGVFRGFDVNNIGAIAASTSNMLVTNNAYFDGSVFRYKAAGASSSYQVGGGTHAWLNAPSGTAGNAINFTQAMTLDASGNLGVGTTTPSSRISVVGPSGLGIGYIETTSGNTNRIQLGTTSGVGYINADAGSGSIALGLNVAGTERARIDSGGRFIVGGTAGGSGPVDGSITTGSLFVNTTTLVSGSASVVNLLHSGGTYFGIMLKNASTNNSNALTFINSSDTPVGSISVTTTTTSYLTTSDYRLKENVQPMTGALAKVAALKPVTYTWKAGGSDGEGFIAHELAEVCPAAVTGEKDEVDADGNPRYQGIDTSFLVATLTAAIQELKAEFDAYKASHP